MDIICANFQTFVSYVILSKKLLFLEYAKIKFQSLEDKFLGEIRDQQRTKRIILNYLFDIFWLLYLIWILLFKNRQCQMIGKSDVIGRIFMGKEPRRR